MGNMDYADSQRQSSISLEVKHPQQTLKITIIFLFVIVNHFVNLNSHLVFFSEFLTVFMPNLSYC